MPTGPASPQRSLLRFTCHTAKRNPPRPLVGATVAVVFPALARRGRYPLAKPRGRSAEVAPPVSLHALRHAARPFGEETLRPSALRAAVSGTGSHFACDGDSSICA